MKHPNTMGWMLRATLIVAIILQSLSSRSQTFSPVADAYIRNGSYANSNFGKSSSLEIKTSSVSGNTRYTLLMFDLSQAGALAVNTATLRLYATSASTMTVGAYRTSSSWSEKNITWNKAPAAGALFSSAAISTSGRYYDWDLSVYVKEMLAAGTKKFAVLLKDVASDGVDMVVSSKEASANKPQLVITTPVAQVPAQPTGLTATAFSSSQINISWTDNANNETGYQVEAKTSAGSYANVASLASNTTSFSHTNLSPASLYTYRVKAINSTGSSLYSNEATATTLPAPTSLVYYIDAVNGNDLNPGTSADLPWKNLTKLYTLDVLPGTKIFLRAGSVWTGQQLKFKGSGTAAAPIVVDKYDVGAKPVLHGNGLLGQGVVYLYNQSYIEVSNLEVTNDPLGPADNHFFNTNGGDRRGVMVSIDNYGLAEHIYFSQMDIHHIKGQLGSGSTSVNGAIPKRTGGIFFSVLGVSETSSSLSRFNDIKIEGCNIYYCENIGIAFDNEWDVFYPGGTEYNDWYKRRFTNIKVRNNTIHHIGKNAMIIRCTDETGLIERNVCYETATGTTGNTMFTARAKGTVFQYNEGYYNRATTQSVNPGNIDGSMYDADFGSVGIVFQYSYSHDNSEGLYWGCNTRGGANNTSGVPDPGDTAVTVRYNISQNDKGDLIFFNYPSAGNKIYNNVFYIGANLSPNIIHESSSQHTYEFYNNIIYNLSPTADYALKDVNQTRIISNNVFYGYHPTGSLTGEPADPFKITADPLFINPGSATVGLNTASGYQLNALSPAINHGKTIVNNGYLDYWSNPLYNGIPDIGAHEFSSTLFTGNNLTGSISNAVPFGGDAKLFPNPARNSFQIFLPGMDQVQEAEVLLLSADGRLVYREPKKIINRSIMMDVSKSNLRGIYWVKIIIGQHTITKMLSIE
jgi:hypothetical protein